MPEVTPIPEIRSNPTDPGVRNWPIDSGRICILRVYSVAIRTIRHDDDVTAASQWPQPKLRHQFLINLFYAPFII